MKIDQWSAYGVVAGMIVALAVIRELDAWDRTLRARQETPWPT
jgi:hypothetical protein